MPSALFEIYQKNFDKTLKRLSGMLELYQNQTKEDQSIALKKIELNISEMERAISQMELESILEKIPDNKKKLGKIIENNKNIVKQFKREIQDLKYKNESILNKKNLAYIPSNKKKKNIQLNFLKDGKDSNNINHNFNEDEDTALFINKNNYNKIVNNSERTIINDNTNFEMNLKRDEAIKRRKDNNDIVNDNDSDVDLKSNIRNSKELNISNKNSINDEKDKDLEKNKYKIYKENLFKKIFKILFNAIQILFNMIITFCKNVINKGRHYLVHRYGQTNSRRIALVIFIFAFIVFYSIILYIWNTFKLKKEIPMGNINLKVQNQSTIIVDSKNDTITNNNITNINGIKTNNNSSNN